MARQERVQAGQHLSSPKTQLHVLHACLLHLQDRLALCSKLLLLPEDSSIQKKCQFQA